jgi:dTDP-4-amino-4,6-dideoxygalactose transaminase
VSVPFNDLARQTHEIERELLEAAERVIRRGRFVLGEELEAFEVAFAAAGNVDHAVGVASGTDAIALGLEALGVGPGDEVVTVTNTCVPTVAGIESAGAIPVLVDAEPATLTIDASQIEAALTERTRAIVPVHLYGQCADMAPILEVASRYDLFVLEDCAQAFGATYGGKDAGTLGHAGAFSFYPTKNLGAAGDAGAVVTSSADVAERVRLLRNYGQRGRFEHVARGRNSRLDEIQAALLAAKLPHVNGWNDRRRQIAAAYTAALADVEVETPYEAEGRRHAFHLYVVRVDDRERIRDRLAAKGIETAVHYPTPVHLQPAYRRQTPERAFPVSEREATRILSLPLYPELDDTEVARVVEELHAAIR